MANKSTTEKTLTTSYSEKLLEDKLIKFTKERGGKVLKLSAQHTAGVPDRLVLLPAAYMLFVELKSTGKKPRALQRQRHKELRALGYDVYVIDNLAALMDMFNHYDNLTKFL